MSFRDGRSCDFFFIKEVVATGSGLPLETPSHNGEYIGPVPVRIIPYGLTGEELSKDFCGDGRFKTAASYRQSAALKSKQRRKLKA